MSDNVIEVEHLSKQYRLGLVGRSTLQDDFARWWASVRGKEDPFLKIGEVNKRDTKGESQYVWSLRDINFSVKRGEVLGIIGKNGAGKSTLLKILSKVTGPTTGKVKVKGRIASLLEVGTGFHPELTGRENVFLNGAILGMRQSEIKAKFDEIVAFAGVERYIDTPVKRYSSGMYVRLAFAVAAHLEPEILIVDEVLAVGDAEFQKKCLGKMKDVSGQGRTVLFVSHNMASMAQLCSSGLLLTQGQIECAGSMQDVIAQYLSATNKSAQTGSVAFPEASDKKLQIVTAKLLNKNGAIISSAITSEEEIYLDVTYRFNTDIKKCNLTLIIQNNSGETVWFLDRTDYHKEYFSAETGKYQASIKIPNPLLKHGEYFITLGLNDMQDAGSDHKFSILKFNIENTNSLRLKRDGHLFFPQKWEMIKL